MVPLLLFLPGAYTLTTRFHRSDPLEFASSFCEWRRLLRVVLRRAGDS